MKTSLPFKPYRGAILDSPFFFFVVPCLRPVISAVHRFRWQLSRPLQIRLQPKWTPPTYFSSLTLGDLLLLLPVVFLIIQGYTLTFVSPNVNGSGNIAGFATLLAFFTANKANSLFTFFLGIPFERLIPHHFFYSVLAIVLGGMHGYVAYAHGLKANVDDEYLLSREDSEHTSFGSDPDLVSFSFDGTINTTGTLLTFTMITLVLTSAFPVFRRHFFNIWLWVHICLAILVVAFSFVHTFSGIVLATVWWLADLILRYGVMAGCLYKKKAALRLVSSDVVEISLPKPKSFEYNPGQYAQLSIPELSALQFHPISISSAPHEATLTFHVRALGKWSTQLVELAANTNECTVLIEGPYGSLSLDLDAERYQMALCISGGIGSTHCHSVAKSLLHDHSQGRKLKKLQYVWVVRDSTMISSLPPVSGTTPKETTNRALGVSQEYQEELVDEDPTEDEEGSGSNAPTVQLSNTATATVQTDIFVTKGTDDEETGSATSHWNIHKGRPDLTELFLAMKTEAIKQGVTHVAVFGCGPHSLLTQVQAECHQHSQGLTECGGVTFDSHVEIFEF